MQAFSTQNLGMAFFGASCLGNFEVCLLWHHLCILFVASSAWVLYVSAGVSSWSLDTLSRCTSSCHMFLLEFNGSLLAEDLVYINVVWSYMTIYIAKCQSQLHKFIIISPFWPLIFIISPVSSAFTHYKLCRLQSGCNLSSPFGLRFHRLSFPPLHRRPLSVALALPFFFLPEFSRGFTSHPFLHIYGHAERTYHWFLRVRYLW